MSTRTLFDDSFSGLGHLQDEATFKLLEGALKGVRIKQIATSADCCLALSGILIILYNCLSKHTN